MEKLSYWNGRAVEARIAYKEDSNAVTGEELAFTRTMVAIIESRLFIRKDVK